MTDRSTADPNSPSSPIPTSLLTFLIADVRGYTRFTVEHGDEAAARLAGRFAELCDESVERHDGRVIELRGDEALCVFSSARQALRAAVALQRSFSQSLADDPSLPLTVGMGLDAGEAIPVRGGYRGGALNLAARLCSIAAGGEILASEGVVHLARKTEGLAFVDRGQVTLKGLPAPVRVLQIAPEGDLPSELPPLQPILVTHPNNLPDEPTPFIGREREIDQIARLLRDPHVRMVTLTGPGGTGKTRLALQVGSTLLHDFSDGVFFVSLASLADPALMPSAVAEVLGVREEADTELVETLVAFLREKHLLLVLDNYEHLLDASSVAAALLDRCRELHILVTSRIPLHLAREREHAVPPLTVPDPAHLPDPAVVSQYEAVALFIERARAVRDTFTVTNDNAPAVAEICSRLDGLPLAIELAASRIKLLPPQALLQRLSSRLKLLTGGPKDRPSRQQTLRGTIEWSYLMLSPEEQALFSRLAVFAGGCTLEAAEAVCDADGSLAIDVFDGLASLVEKSLVQQSEQPDGEPRFAMLETIREFALERLGEGEEGLALRDAHAHHYASRCIETVPPPGTPAEVEWNRRLSWDVANLRAARQWLREHDPAVGLVLGKALYSFWAMRGFWGDARVWLDDVDQHRQILEPEERVPVLDVAAKLRLEYYGDRVRSEKLRAEALELRRELGDTAAVADEMTLAGERALREDDATRAGKLYAESLALQRQIDNTRGIFAALNGLVMVANHLGDYAAARAHAEEAIALVRGQDDKHELAAWLNVLGQSLVWQGLPGAEGVLQESLRLRRDLEDLNCIPRSLTTLAELALEQGDAARAAELQEESLALLGEQGNKQRVAWSLLLLGRAAFMSADARRAAQLFRESLLKAQEAGDRHVVAAALTGLAEVAAAEGAARHAARLVGAAETIQASLPGRLPPTELAWQERCGAAIRAQLGDGAWDAAWNEGRSLAEGEAASLAAGWRA